MGIARFPASCQSKTVPQTSRVQRSSATLTQLALASCVVTLLYASAARAQFSGPGVTAPNPTWNAEPATTDPATLYPASRSIFINTGDLMVLRLYGAPDYNPTVRVTLEGTVQLPLIGVVSVKGLTLDQAENLIADKLKTSGMYRDPQVTLQILESTNGVITVGGEAHTVIPASTEHRLFEILALAGGLPTTASHTLTINRPGVPQPIVVNLGNDPLHSQDANIPVYPGDTIILARVGVVYMLGEFKNAGVIQIQQNSPLTLLQATSVAGGTAFSGRFQDLRIIRTVDKQRTLVRVDVKRVMLGKDPDPLLQADDIVYLPTSAVKAALLSGGLNVLLSVANLSLIAAHY